MRELRKVKVGMAFMRGVTRKGRLPQLDLKYHMRLNTLCSVIL